jgi:hypothetical protein
MAMGDNSKPRYPVGLQAHAEYAAHLRQAGLLVEKRWGNPFTLFRRHASSSPANLSYPFGRGVPSSLDAGPRSLQGPGAP